MIKIANSLIDPNSKQKLELDWDSGKILNLSENFEGKIVDNIPVILPKTSTLKSKFHQQKGSHFDYIEHYKEDAFVFDYFEEPNEITQGEKTRLNQKLIQNLDNNFVSVLDVGCGGGWLSKAIQTDKTEVTSLDISLKNVQQTLKNTPHQNHSGIVSDVFNLPFLENTFDRVVACEIIEHLVDPKLFIENLLKITKPNGKIVISTPYDEKIPLSLCVHCNKATPRHAHLHSFNDSNIHRFLPESAGVKIEKMANKYLFRLRIYHLLRFLPFSIWFNLDKLANTIINKPERLIITLTKK